MVAMLGASRQLIVMVIVVWDVIGGSLGSGVYLHICLLMTLRQ